MTKTEPDRQQGATTDRQRLPPSLVPGAPVKGHEGEERGDWFFWRGRWRRL